MAETSERRTLEDWKLFCEQVQASTSVALTESEADQRARKTRALKDYNYFVKTYFTMYADHDCADFHIKAADAILADRNIMAILEWPREHAKSVHADILIPMWLLAHGQLTGMVLMGKNETDAMNLLGDIQAQLEFNSLFCHDWGAQKNIGSWETGEFTTQDGVRFLSIGRDQSPRGARSGEKRPNYAVVDDVDDDIIVHNEKRTDNVVKRIMSALYFGLATKAGRLVIAGNRIHPRSILAKLVGDINPKTPKRKGIFHSKVYASHKPGAPDEPLLPSEGGVPAWKRYTKKELQRKIDKAGRVLANQEFYHKHSVDGKIFLEKKFHWSAAPPLSEFVAIEGYFDPSFENNPTSDFKAISVWGTVSGRLWCLKKFVRRCSLEEAFEWMFDFDEQLPEGVGVIWRMEKQFITSTIKAALTAVEKKRGRPLRIITDHRVKENKYVRIVKMEPFYTGDLVAYDAREFHDPDMIEGNDQLKGIEPGYKSPDDSPDADEGAWFYLLPLLDHKRGASQYRTGKRTHKVKTY